MPSVADTGRPDGSEIYVYALFGVFASILYIFGEERDDTTASDLFCITITHTFMTDHSNTLDTMI